MPLLCFCATPRERGAKQSAAVLRFRCRCETDPAHILMQSG